MMRTDGVAPSFCIPQPDQYQASSGTQPTDAIDLAATLVLAVEQAWPRRRIESITRALRIDAEHLAPRQRAAVVNALHVLWNQARSRTSIRSREDVIVLAAHLCAWPLLIRVARTCEEKRMHYSDPDSVCLSLLEAYRQLGWVDSATALAKEIDARRSYSGAGYGETCCDIVESWACWRDQRVPMAEEEIQSSSVWLEPLGHHHQQAFHWQYASPRIAKWCALPAFEDALQWHRWLDETLGNPNETIYAIQHAVWGFIGCVSIIRSGDSGYLYYWIGEDFQGRGLGFEAVKRAIAHMTHHLRLQRYVAKVVDGNHASVGLLQKIGFRPVALHCAPSHVGEQFFYLGAPMDTRAIQLHMLALLAKIDPLTYEMLAAPAPVAQPNAQDMFFTQPSLFPNAGAHHGGT